MGREGRWRRRTPAKLEVEGHKISAAPAPSDRSEMKWTTSLTTRGVTLPTGNLRRALGKPLWSQTIRAKAAPAPGSAEHARTSRSTTTRSFNTARRSSFAASGVGGSARSRGQGESTVLARSGKREHVGMASAQAVVDKPLLA